MRYISLLFQRWNAPKLSRFLLWASAALLTAWLQAHLVLAAVHDDGTTVRNAITVYNSGEVRDQVSGAVDWAFDQDASIAGGSPELIATQTAVRAALHGGAISPAVSAALVASLLDMRDDALAQFASSAPTHALTVDLEPLLIALGVEITPELRSAVSASTPLAQGATLDLPILAAAQVDTLRTRYHWAVLIDRWGLLVAAVAGFVGIVLARRPLRTFSIALMVGGALAILAIPLFGFLRDWLIGGGIGAWGALMTPLITSAISELTPWLMPLGIAAIVVGAGIFGWLLFAARRAGAPRASEPPQDHPSSSERMSSAVSEPEKGSLSSTTA